MAYAYPYPFITQNISSGLIELNEIAPAKKAILYFYLQQISSDVVPH